MQRIQSIVGPRSWALLTLLGGAGMASPFLRPSQVGRESAIGESPRESALPSESHLASVGSARPDGANENTSAISLQEQGGMPLPTTNAAEPSLPAWATPRSRLDEVISQGVAPPWEGDSKELKLQPVQPWLNRRRDESSQTASRFNPNGLSDQQLPLDYRTSPWEAPGGIHGKPESIAQVAGTAMAQPWPDSLTRAIPNQSQVPSPTSAATLAGATLGRSSATEKPRSASPTLPPRRPQFVFQPGLSRE